MTITADVFAKGGCTCGEVRIALQRAPMFVHCCHCTWCQRETGSAFVVNALIESAELQLLRGAPERVDTPSASGKGQVICRCPTCRVALWSHYGGAGDAVAFVRVGVLDRPALCPPDIHIYAASRLPWVRHDDRVPVMEGFYRYRDRWPEDSFQRLLTALGRD